MVHTNSTLAFFQFHWDVLEQGRTRVGGHLNTQHQPNLSGVKMVAKGKKLF